MFTARYELNFLYIIHVNPSVLHTHLNLHPALQDKRAKTGNHQKACSRSFLVWLFTGFAGISYGRFMAIHYKFNLSTYVQEPLVIGRRGYTGTDLNRETVGSR